MVRRFGPGCGKEDEPAARGNSMDGCLHGVLHAIHSPKGYCIEDAIRRHGFDPLVVDFSSERQGAERFAKEGSLLALGFAERDLCLRTDNRDGDYGQARPGAEIEETPHGW